MKLKVYVCLSLCLLSAGAVLIRTTRPATKDRLALRGSAVLPRTEHSLEAVAKASPDENKARLVNSYGRLPLSFEANRGQTDPQVKFVSRGQGYTLFLTRRGEAVLALRKPAPQRDPLKSAALESMPAVLNPEAAGPPAIVRMKLVGANAKPRVEALDELPGKANYFIGNDPKKWRTNVPLYANVRYRDVYPGVDLVYHGNQQQLEHDFVVPPGADPRSITLHLAGAEKLSLDPRGALVLAVKDGELRLDKPHIYQEIDGARREISGGYVLKNAHQVSFQIAAYDASKPLVIDPTLFYSTYLGGSNQDFGNGIAVDSAGNAYVTGYTSSTDFPTTPGAFQPTNPTPSSGNIHAFVTKVNPTGSAPLVYSTYLGGNSDDIGLGIALDSAGNAYVTGYTASTNFPTTLGAFQPTDPSSGNYHAFVTKVNPAGSAPLVYSTYLGGNIQDIGEGIAVDAGGNAYVTGYTYSTNFPTTLGAFQPTDPTPSSANIHAFVTKVNPTGSAPLVYSTYLGGNYQELGQGIAVDAGGNAYVTGYTASTNFPTTLGAFQPTDPSSGSYHAFVTKLNPTGTAPLVYSTYLGGNNTDVGFGIAVDSAGNAYVTGYTCSTTFPTTPGAFQTANASGGCYDAFVTKLNPTGTAPLVYSTYLGGNNTDVGFGIAVDAAGNAFVTGYTYSTDFPTTPGAFQTTNAGLADAFVTALNPLGTAPLVYSTYLGGSNYDFGLGGAVDSLGNAYVTGYTYSTNFPTTTGAFQTANASGGCCDAFVAKITGFQTDAPITAKETTFDATEGVTFAGTVATFTDPDPASTAAEYSATIDWGDGTPTSAGTISGPSGGPFTVNGTHMYAEEGSYKVTVTITDIDTPSNTATAHSTATVIDAPLASKCATTTPISTQTYTGPTAIFTDQSSTGTLSDFSATISWGDSSSSAGTISGGPGNAPYTVSGTHTYASAGTFLITTSIKDVGGSTTTTACSVTTEAPITAQGTTFGATEGVTSTGTVATFTDPDPASTAAEYSATIDWGDGSPTTPGTITGPPGGPFTVSGTHMYAEEGRYRVTVTITDVDNRNNNATVISTANVSDAPLMSKCATTPVSTQTYTGRTAIFTDQSSTGTLSDFSATISWGDASSSAGTISGGPGNAPYTVTGTHTYASTGTFSITTTIKDVGGSTTTTPACSVTIFAFATGNGAAFVIGDLEAGLGNHVTWWSSQWAIINVMSGGAPPNAMKGFAGFEDNFLGLPPPNCGGSWSTDTGNSTPPPPSVPNFMGVIVSSRVTQSGSIVSGDIKQVVIVRNDPGYGPSPGHPGTGTEIAIVCAIP